MCLRAWRGHVFCVLVYFRAYLLDYLRGLRVRVLTCLRVSLINFFIYILLIAKIMVWQLKNSCIYLQMHAN